MFDFLVPENLSSTLLDVRINSPKCSLSRIAQWFDFTNFITEKQNSQQYAVLYTEMNCTLVFILWVFTFWNLLPEINCRVALTKVFLEPDFFCISASLISAAVKCATNGM